MKTNEYPRAKEEFACLESFLPKNDLILEAGCGLGPKLIHFDSKNYKIWGIDYIYYALNQVKIKSILTKITSISLRKPVGIERKSEFGYDNANAIVEIFGSDSNGDNFSYILTVGGEFEGEGSNINDVLFYVKATNKDYWVLVPEYEVLEITEVDYDYFLK